MAALTSGLGSSQEELAAKSGELAEAQRDMQRQALLTSSLRAQVRGRGVRQALHAVKLATGAGGVQGGGG